MKLLTRGQIVTIIVSVLFITFITHYDDFMPYRWEAFRASDGSFSAQFPSTPRAAESKVRLSAEETTVIHVISADTGSHAAYLASYFEDPKLANGSAEDALNSAREGGISKVQGTVISERHLVVDGYPAQEVEIHARGNSIADMLLIAAGRRMFVFEVAETDGQQPDSKNIRKFYDSINISKEGVGTHGRN